MGGAITKVLLVDQDQATGTALASRLETLGLTVLPLASFTKPEDADLILFSPDSELDEILRASAWREKNGHWIPMIALAPPGQAARACLEAGCDLSLPMDLDDEHFHTQIEALVSSCRFVQGPLADHQDYRRIFQAIRHPILILSPDQTILAVNREVEKSTGMNESELVGKRCFNIFHKTDSPPDGCPLVTLLEDGTMNPVDMVMQAMGKDYFVSTTPILDKNGQVERIIHVSTDVTKRVEAERKLARQKEDYRLLAETTDDMILVHGLDGSIKYLNRAALEFFGIDEDQVPGTRISDYMAPEYQELLVSRNQEMIAGSNSNMVFDIEAIDRLGQGVKLEAKSAPIIQQGKTKGILLTARDNRERRKIQEQLLQAQKMEAVGRLAAGVSHDFNNLLTAILGNCDLVQADVESGDDPKEGLGEIQNAAERACALTQRLLAFSRQRPSMARVLDLNSAIKDLEKMLRRVIGEDIDLMVAGTKEALTVKVDPVRFEQVVLNLAVNARDAMPSGGKLSFRLRTVQLDDESAKAHPGLKPGRYHELSVSDTGFGMTEEVRKQVFEPFFTTKEEGRGTGLGLSTVKDILTEAGGQTLVYSEVGKGTTFRLFWPPAEQAAARTEDVRIEPSSSKGETILVLEDESIVRSMVKTALERAGYKVIEATDGEQAIHKASNKDTPIDLLLADVVLPGEMNGPQVAEKLNREHPKMKTIHMSGYSGDIIFTRSEHISPNLLQKPFSLNDLLSTVRRVLDS